MLLIVYVICMTFRELAVPSPSAACLSVYSPSSLLLISKQFARNYGRTAELVVTKFAVGNF